MAGLFVFDRPGWTATKILEKVRDTPPRNCCLLPLCLPQDPLLTIFVPRAVALLKFSSHFCHFRVFFGDFCGCGWVRPSFDEKAKNVPVETCVGPPL